MTDTKNDFDSPWKQILEDYFTEFVTFFFPSIHQNIDWEKGYEFLDTELQKVVHDAELGKRYADRLVKVWKQDGEECWVLIHIEVQQGREAQFSERMYVYNYRLRDRYDRPIVSLAILTDENQTWRPHTFESGLWGCEVNFRFPIVKLIDYGKDWQALEESRNPFSTVVMAHLKALETRNNSEKRQDWKFRLSRRLYEKSYDRQDILNLFRFIDWIIRLPEDLEIRFREALETFEQEREMPYITSIERLAKQEGRQEGLREGLLSGIELALKLKFGEDKLTNLFSEISEIEEVELLRSIQAQIVQAQTLEELRNIYNSP